MKFMYIINLGRLNPIVRRHRWTFDRVLKMTEVEKKILDR